MKFGQRHSIRDNLTSAEFATGIWNPEMPEHRDIVEDYLYISRKRIKNKLSMFNLQLHIMQEIITNNQVIEGYNNLREKLTSDEKAGKITKDEYDYQTSHIKSEIFKANILKKAFREIVDGIVWKFFDYNRPILYMLADKEPIEAVRRDQGTLANLHEFSEAFLEHGTVAIYNDITNFLRVGDITQIKEDGSIEIIEVKSSKTRGKRITRQKQRMAELVNFFNTGYKNYDGNMLKIVDSNVKQRTYLNQLQDAIRRAKNKGYESLLIGKHIILEIVDFGRVRDKDDFTSLLSKKHESVRADWEKNKDFVHMSFLIDKMNYSKNCAPISIYPFDIETCADLIIGKLMVSILFNFTEILRTIERAGWEIVDSLIFKTADEIKSFYEKDIKDVTFLKIRKGGLTFEVPPSLIARIQYELLSPSSLIDEIEEIYNKGPQKDFDFYLINYVDDKKMWQ